jgi:adenylate kinase
MNNEPLTVIGEGNNIVPTIHVKDLTKLIKKLGETKSEQKYYTAIDRTQNKKQSEIIASIAKGLGNGQIKNIPKPKATEYFIKEDRPYNSLIYRLSGVEPMLCLDININPSSLISTFSEEAGFADNDFEWHCKGGINENIIKIADEFCKKENLSPIKIAVHGPRCAGKTFYSKILKKEYNIEHITVEYAIEFASKQANELGEKFKTVKPPTPEMIADACKQALRSNACKYRGFILDGYPSTYHEAELLYWKKPKAKVVEKKQDDENAEANKEPEDQPNEEDLKPVFEQDIFPLSVLFLEADDSYLHANINKISKIDAAGVSKCKSDIETYNRMNLIGSCDIVAAGKSLPMFYKEKKTEVLQIPLPVEKDEEMLETLRIYIERIKRPFNYLRSKEAVLQERMDYLKAEEEKRRLENDKRKGQY